MQDIDPLRDVTAVFDHFRVSARSIWNNAFWPDPEFREGYYIGRFEWIAEILFDALVLSKLDMDYPCKDLFRKPIPFFQVVPASQTVPLMIQNPRSRSETGYWDDPVKQVSLGRVEMHFISFFDWSQVAVLDYRYYRASIARFDEQPHLVGREALIETHCAKVIFTGEPENS
jgi:hypothetical protein